MSYLTGPVNTLTDFQVEFNGFLMGPGTNYDVPPVWDFLDLGALKSMDQSRDWADGSWSGPDFADVLLPQMDVEVFAPDAITFAAAVNSLRNVFTVNSASVPLWVKLPNMPAFGIGAKTNARVLPVDIMWNGLTKGSVQWRCTDPTWQSVPRTLSLSSSSATGSGMLFPMFTQGTGTAANAGMDFGSTSANASSGTLTNAGNAPAWPVVVVSGPVTNFTINLDGNLVTWTDTVPAGQTLTVDYSTGLATLTGNVDRTYSLTSRAFSAVPAGGTSTVFFTASTGTATVTVADVSR